MILRIRDSNGNVQEVLAIRGEDGKDYVLTEEDKREIAGMAVDNIDLSKYVTKEDYATDDTAGVVFTNSAAGIEAKYGVLKLVPATEALIAKKQMQYMPIVPKTIDQAVKVGVTTNTKALTEAEKTAACGWLGAAKAADVEPILTQYTETWTFTLEDGSTVMKTVVLK